MKVGSIFLKASHKFWRAACMTLQKKEQTFGNEGTADGVWLLSVERGRKKITLPEKQS